MIINTLMKRLSLAGLIGLLYFLAHWTGAIQTTLPNGIAIVWPGKAIILTALLATPRREWPLIGAAVLAAEYLAGIPAFPFWAVTAFALVNLFEGVLAATLIRRFAGPDFNFELLGHLLIFILVAPLFASSLAGLFGTAVYYSFYPTDTSFLGLWRTWWFGDALGLLLLTPLLLSAWRAVRSERPSVNWPKLLELIAVWVSIAICGIYAYGVAGQAGIEFELTLVLLLALTIWTAMRFGILATAATVTLIAALATGYLVLKLHSYDDISSQHAVWMAQQYLAVVGIIAYGVRGLMHKIRLQRDFLRLQERAMLASNDSVVIADITQPDMPLIWVNSKFEELFGYRSEEILGRNCRFLQKENRRQPNLEIVRTALAQKKPCRVQLKNYTKTGKPLWIELSLAPVTDDAGRVTHYVGIQHDLTQEKQIEKRLRNLTHALQRQNELLEEKVQQRTQSLQETNTALHSANQKLEHIASIDFLTGIANRRHFYELSQRTLKRLGKDGRIATMIAFDLDHFKDINDTLGHEAGDHVLRQVVAPVENNIRPDDFFGRVGGEEFLILLPDTNENTALAIAERIRAQISETLTHYHSIVIQVTASFGVVTWDGYCDLDHLIRQTDHALYQAKNEGRNLVRLGQCET